MDIGRRLVLATTNTGKAREFSRLLAGVFQVETVPPSLRLPEEKGQTFVENARLKAEAVFAALGGEVAVLADDSGLEVVALGGRPGVLSARYAGEGASDDENVAHLLDELEGITDRRARFVCALCLMLPAAAPEARSFVWSAQQRASSASDIAERARQIVEVMGTLEGTITEAPRGSGGFGYDPVFQPCGWRVTLAEASPQDKDRVSHRGAAARALLERLRAERLLERQADLSAQ